MNGETKEMGKMKGNMKGMKGQGKMKGGCKGHGKGMGKGHHGMHGIAEMEGQKEYSTSVMSRGALMRRWPRSRRS